MDNMSPGIAEKRGLTNGPSMRRGRSPSSRPHSAEGSPSPGSGGPVPGHPHHPIHHHHHHLHHSPLQQITVIVHKDERGYGMKVSGDNPVFVQSVKEGGAAERAGLHSGDTIIRVNGVDVTHSTHTEVVDLIKSSSQPVLTVQQSPLRDRPSTINPMASPKLQTRHHSLQTRDRVTAPQPVDNEKMRQLECQRVHTLRLMLEKEQRYVESLRSKLARSDTVDPKLQHDLSGGEKRVQTLQLQLMNLTSDQESAGPQVLTHHRTKSSPDTLSTNVSLAEASKRLIASESMKELSESVKRPRGDSAWEVDSPRATPPGTPPPPYGGSQPQNPECYAHIHDEVEPRAEGPPGDLSDSSPVKFGNFVGQGGGQAQQPIISMEDEDMLSDQEMNQLEDHGPFKSLSKLWSHPAHLAVFLNYVISNSDPSSLLFYLVTDLYKEGNAKEMKKWAYELHSSFLVPGAPLRLSNVDENVAREIDEVLLKESDKEEILRKVFWKARLKAKEELNEQLADFQAKRTAGLGTLFGPSDALLDESIHDKSKEMKIIETILIPKMEPYLNDIETDDVDDRRFTTGAALGTVMGKVFGLRGPHFSSILDRCPTYVSKDKSLKSKIIGRTTRKVTVRGHHCVLHQYYTVTYCNHCQLIIWGIGPQGYQCSDCGLNIHRNCVRVVEENCPGPMVKKEKGNDRISKIIERIRPENTRRTKPNSFTLASADRTKRLQEEEGGTLTDNEIGGSNSNDGYRTNTYGRERPGGGGRGQQERRPDPVRETEERTHRSINPHHDHHTDNPNNIQDLSHLVTKVKPAPTSINRSESYKERIHQKRQHRERRKTSDPNLSKTNNDVELDPLVLSYHTNSGSSSNSSLSTRSLESPSGGSVEAVSGGCGSVPMWDSDTEAEPDPPDWTKNVPEEVVKQLSQQERKRQEIINELFHTERTHVRRLRVLDQVFYKPIREQQILPSDQIELLFANLEEMLGIHSQFNNLMKAKRKENPVVADIGPLLSTMFEGENFQKAAVTFCARQQLALDALKEKRKKDPKLQSFLTDAEMNPVCRRLQLKDIIPAGWIRLTKYPLLLESLAKHTPPISEDYDNIHWAIERSKEILNHVNKAVKEAQDEHRLADMQRRLDKSQFEKVGSQFEAAEFKNIDFTKHRLIHEGGLNLRIANRQKLIEVHVLLLEDVIVLLQKQDEKYILKFYSNNLSPIIKVSTVLVRSNAVDKKALFLVNTSQNGAQIYDLVAPSYAEKRIWFKHISDAAEAYKQRDGKHRRPEPTSISANTDLDTSDSSVHDKTKENDDTGEGNSSEMLSPPRSNGPEQDSPSPNSDSTPLPSAESTPQASPAPHTPEPTTATKLGDGGPRRGEESLRLTTESALIEPTEVLISQRDVLTAEPVLTPLEKLRRKDEDIRQALLEKQALVADILHVPRDEFETIAELAGEPAVDKEATELILAAVNQANQLSFVVNECLRITEEETVQKLATSEVVGSNPKTLRLPGVPAHKIQGIATALNAHLTQLLNIMTERDEERDRLRREVQRSREQIHALHERQNHNGPSAIQEEAVTTPPLPSPVPGEPITASEVFVDALSGEVENTVEVQE